MSRNRAASVRTLALSATVMVVLTLTAMACSSQSSQSVGYRFFGGNHASETFHADAAADAGAAVSAFHRQRAARVCPGGNPRPGRAALAGRRKTAIGPPARLPARPAM